jgi:hypothetical protein
MIQTAMHRERDTTDAGDDPPQEREAGNGALDEAVEDSFPASDPISSEDPGR